jgi:hypothetical protein
MGLCLVTNVDHVLCLTSEAERCSVNAGGTGSNFNRESQGLGLNYT